MQFEQKQLPHQQVELTVHVTRDDAKPHLQAAATRLSTRRPIKGFRPGKAPFDVVKKEFGEPAILEEGLEDVVNASFNEVLEQTKIDTYGRINFSLLPVANADEAVAYKAIVTLMPQVKLGNWQTPKISHQEAKVTPADLDKALGELSEMLIKDEVSSEPAKLGDKAMVDFDVFVDGKAIDGGSAKDFALVLGENRMIPGFEEKIVGSKTGDKLEFKLNFPKDYHAQNLAGKEADFKISVNQVLNRIKPTIDDLAAEQLGMGNLEQLRSHFHGNIQKEKQQQEEERMEIAAIKQLVSSSEFSEIPKLMLADSAHDMVHEMEHDLKHQGVSLDGYLKSINKTEQQMIADFEPKAGERIKASLALGKLAETENLKITNEEVDAAIKSDNSPDRNRPEYRRHVANHLLNRKIIEFLKSKLIE